MHPNHNCFPVLLAPPTNKKSKFNLCYPCTRWSIIKPSEFSPLKRLNPPSFCSIPLYLQKPSFLKTALLCLSPSFEVLINSFPSGLFPFLWGEMRIEMFLHGSLQCPSFSVISFQSLIPLQKNLPFP